jgi:hypothetical protein
MLVEIEQSTSIAIIDKESVAVRRSWYLSAGSCAPVQADQLCLWRRGRKSQVACSGDPLVPAGRSCMVTYW